jgi:CRISPR/Cas system-associated exonuclease Cas4 (RecB family)
LRKACLDAVSPADETVESAWAKVRGTLLHYVGRSLGWNELAVKLTFRANDDKITIVGFVEAYDPETATIFDLKTTRFVKWQAEKKFIPRGNHSVQVQCYATMLENYGISVARLVLVYVDDKDIVPVQVPLGNRREWMIRRATYLHEAFAKKQEPMPEVSSSCKYCSHASTCPQAGGKNLEDEIS